jgi:hypothetical protein
VLGIFLESYPGRKYLIFNGFVDASHLLGRN